MWHSWHLWKINFCPHSMSWDTSCHHCSGYDYKWVTAVCSLQQSNFGAIQSIVQVQLKFSRDDLETYRRDSQCHNPCYGLTQVKVNLEIKPCFALRVIYPLSFHNAYFIAKLYSKPHFLLSCMFCSFNFKAVDYLLSHLTNFILYWCVMIQKFWSHGSSVKKIHIRYNTSWKPYHAQ